MARAGFTCRLDRLKLRALKMYEASGQGLLYFCHYHAVMVLCNFLIIQAIKFVSSNLFGIFFNYIFGGGLFVGVFGVFFNIYNSTLTFLFSKFCWLIPQNVLQSSVIAIVFTQS